MVKSLLVVKSSFLLESISTHFVRKELEEVIINLWFCIKQERWQIWNSFPYTGLKIQICVCITSAIVKTDFVTSNNLSRVFPWKFRKLQHYVKWVKFATFLLFIFREWVQLYYFTFLFKFLLVMRSWVQNVTYPMRNLAIFSISLTFCYSLYLLAGHFTCSS